MVRWRACPETRRTQHNTTPRGSTPSLSIAHGLFAHTDSSIINFASHNNKDCYFVNEPFELNFALLPITVSN